MRYWIGLFLLLALVATSEANPASSPAVPSAAWIRENAENILFLEHLREQAAEDDLYEWRSKRSSADYQTRLDQLLSVDDSTCVSSSCGSSECSSSSSCGSACATSVCSEDSSMLVDRVSVLENRCGESSSCGQTVSCASGCEMSDQKILLLQSELRKQRQLIQRLYQQVTIISQTSTSCSGNI